MLLLEHYLDYLSEQVGKHNDVPEISLIKMSLSQEPKLKKNILQIKI